MPAAPTASVRGPVPGAVLVGKYRVDRVLGRGGMGVVVEARHLVLDDRVALKFLLPELAMLPDATERFLREARAVIRIKGEHVARVMDVGTLESGEPFLVMEFLDGQDLHELIKRTGPMRVADAVDYIIQACDAIAEAHSIGVIHRDIKLANLFRTVGPDGSVIIKVLDFGISKVSGARGIDPLTRTKMTMGSAHYMSPEQMHSMRDVDHRTDIYSLGVSLFTLLAGAPPFPGESAHAVYAHILTGTPLDLHAARPDVPEPLARAIGRAIARDRTTRYPSVAELVFAISPWAPPQSKPTIDRIARMIGRVAPPTPVSPEPLSAGAWMAPQALGPASGVAAGSVIEAKTQVFVARRRPSNAPLFVFLGLLVPFGLALVAGLVWMRSRRQPAAIDATEHATPQLEAAPPSAPEAVPAASSAPAAAARVDATVATTTADVTVATPPSAPLPGPRVPAAHPPPRPSAAATQPTPSASPAASRPGAFDMR